MNSFAISRTGHGKSKNEDCFLHMNSKDGRVSFFVVADGMGGYVCGEIASKIVTDIFDEKTKSFEFDNFENLEKFLKETVKIADSKIKEEIESDKSKEGMGSTVVVFSFVKETSTAVFCNVGDSKAFVYSEGNISFSTHDHSVAQLMLDKGYTEEETKLYLKQNPITKAIGYLDDDEEGDTYRVEIKNDDVVLLCSDGFYKGLEQTEIGWLLKENFGKQPESVCSALVYDALGRESTDDITVIVVDI